MRPKQEHGKTYLDGNGAHRCIDSDLQKCVKFLDSKAWASGGFGLTVLLVAGVLLAAFALHHIQKPSEEKGEQRKLG